MCPGGTIPTWPDCASPVGVKVFVDTSAWYALMDKDDAHHEAAWAAFPHMLERGRGLTTTNHVVGETYTLIRSSLGYRKAWEFLDLLGQSRRVERLFTPADMESEAYDLLEKYADQDFSFVDATSFAWMRVLKLREAFAFDKHFRVMGFAQPRF